MIKILSASGLSIFAIMQISSLAFACSPKPSLRWEQIGKLPAPVESHAMAISQNRLYVLGGWNEQDGPRSQVAFTEFGPGGNLTPWQFTVPMPLSLQHHAVIVHKQALYILGGDTGFGENSLVSDRIFRGIPNAQGHIEGWMEIGKLPDRRTIHGVTTFGDRIYVIGGAQDFQPNSKVVRTILTTTFTPSGGLNPWQTLENFPEPIGWLTATFVGKHLYAIAGKVNFAADKLTENVWKATVQSQGKLTPFVKIGKTQPRERHATVAIANTLLLIGGGGDKAVLNTVEAATIGDQGNISPWRSLPPLPEARYAHAATAYHKQVYVSGGFVKYGNNETSQIIWRMQLCN